MAQAKEEKQDYSTMIVRRERTTDSEASVNSMPCTVSPEQGGTGWSPIGSTTKFNMLDIP